MNNIFSTLFKYCVFSQENYLTEAFVYLLIELLKREPKIGLALLSDLTGFSSVPKLLDASIVACSTQVTVDEGRPDIEIQYGDQLQIYIEVKHDAPLHTGQLEAYKTELGRSSFPETRLVLLTRSHQTALETTLAPDEYHHYCWYQVHNFLSSAEIKDKVAEFLSEQFLEFLEEKGMNLNKVTWEYIDGIPALLNLINMVEVAIEEAIPGVKIKRTGGWNWRGFYVGEIFCGVRYDLPLVLVFENNGGWHTTYKRDLDLETKLFFAMKKDQQFDMLIEFIKESYKDMPKKLETVNAEPPKDEDVISNN